MFCRSFGGGQESYLHRSGTGLCDGTPRAVVEPSRQAWGGLAARLRSISCRLVAIADDVPTRPRHIVDICRLSMRFARPISFVCVGARAHCSFAIRCWGRFPGALEGTCVRGQSEGLVTAFYLCASSPVGASLCTRELGRSSFAYCSISVVCCVVGSWFCCLEIVVLRSGLAHVASHHAVVPEAQIRPVVRLARPARKLGSNVGARRFGRLHGPSTFRLPPSAGQGAFFNAADLARNSRKVGRQA